MSSISRDPRLLDLPLRDLTSGEGRARMPAELDQSLRERVLSSGKPLREPERPAGARSSVRVAGDGVHIDLPAPGWYPGLGMNLLGGIIGTAVLGFVGLLVLTEGTGDTAKILPLVPGKLAAVVPIAGVALVLLTFGAGPALWAMGLRTRITVSTGGVRFRRRLWFLPLPSGFMDSKSLEEADIGRSIAVWMPRKFSPEGPVVRLHSDRKILELGYGLSRAELAWLRDLITYYVEA